MSVDRFTAVDDFGKVINPMIVEGQVHGGLAQGIGQALTEGCRYDENGQLLTGSLSDYCIPRAGDVPQFKIDTRETPCTHNPLGVKGCGEAGCAGGLVAITNAVVDALSDYGIRHLDMPMTPARVWQAIQDAQGGDAGTRDADRSGLVQYGAEVSAFATTAEALQAIEEQRPHVRFSSPRAARSPAPAPAPRPACAGGARGHGARVLTQLRHHIGRQRHKQLGKFPFDQRSREQARAGHEGKTEQ